MEIKNWRELKVGQHIRLSCGCAGFVTAVYLTGENPSDIGFKLAYTSENCGGKRQTRWGNRKSYSEGYGPYTNFFNYDLCDGAMPAEEVPAPSWWQKLETGPDRKLQEFRRKFWAKKRAEGKL